MVPFGAWIVFTTAALLLAFQGGSVFAATGVFFFGAVVMVIGDTFVWPTLVGNQARLPFLAALIGIFGGLQTFGLIGLFIGPMILAGFGRCGGSGWCRAQTRKIARNPAPCGIGPSVLLELGVRQKFPSRGRAHQGAFGPTDKYQSKICSPVMNATSGFFRIFSKIFRKYFSRCGAPMM